MTVQKTTQSSRPAKTTFSDPPGEDELRLGMHVFLLTNQGTEMEPECPFWAGSLLGLSSLCSWLVAPFCPLPHAHLAAASLLSVLSFTRPLILAPTYLALGVILLL